MKRAAADGQRIKGVHLTIAELTLIEVLAGVGPISSISTASTLRSARAISRRAAWRPSGTGCRRSPAFPIAKRRRSPGSSIAAFIVVPHVDSVADAAEVIDAAYYAPLGQRSFGGSRPHFGLNIADTVAYLAECNADLSVCIMIESRSALEQAGDIAALPGIDYLSFRMNDRAQALGLAGDAKGSNTPS